MSLRSLAVPLVLLVVLAGCRVVEGPVRDVEAGAETQQKSAAPAAAVLAPGTSAPVPDARPVDPGIAAVSLSNPTAEAAQALEVCRVADYGADKVAAMGHVDRAREVTHYVRLGQHPELQTDKPAFVVEFRGELPVARWIMTDPTCIVIDGEALFFGTGPVRLVGEEVQVTPQPIEPGPDRALPPVQP